MKNYLNMLVSEIDGEEIQICRDCGVVYRYNQDLKCPLCTLVKELKNKVVNIEPNFYNVPPHG